MAATGGVALVLAAVQAVGMSAYGDLAVPGALPARVGPALALAVARRCLEAPLGELRVACARIALHRGAPDAAQAIATLPQTPAADDLRGQLAEARGDDRAAIAAYVRARDVERSQRLIDAIAASTPGRARSLETALLGNLGGAADATVRARAWWRLGQLDQIVAAADPTRRELAVASLDAYRNALALAPNEETYLLAAGEQALTLGRPDLARAYYARALAAVPDSADARRGLARSAP